LEILGDERTSIRPRTRSERLAFITGFALALEMIEYNGVKAARKWLKESFESEERINE
jgi:hypothetical protein